MQSVELERLVQKGLRRRETHHVQELHHKLYREKLLKVSEQTARATDVSHSPDGDFASTAGRGTAVKLPLAGTHLGSSFDPKKLVSELDQKLKRLQMMSAASECEIGESAQRQAAKRRAVNKPANARNKCNLQESLIELSKKEVKKQGRASLGLAGTQSSSGPQRKSLAKVDVERTGACSPEYNIYSDSDVDGSFGDNASPQKEGGSPERSQDGKNQASSASNIGNSAFGSSVDARQKHSISDNRLAQNGGNIVHQKLAPRKRAPGMAYDLNPVRPAEEEENKLRIRRALETKQ